LGDLEGTAGGRERPVVRYFEKPFQVDTMNGPRAVKGMRLWRHPDTVPRAWSERPETALEIAPSLDAPFRKSRSAPHVRQVPTLLGPLGSAMRQRCTQAPGRGDRLGS